MPTLKSLRERSPMRRRCENKDEMVSMRDWLGNFLIVLGIVVVIHLIITVRLVVMEYKKRCDRR
jgi:hypothetical protein